jgi:disulfide bond formation protein DsbB
MTKLSFKKVYFICFLVTCLFTVFTVFLQNWYTFLPCPLNHIERIILLILAAIFLVIMLYKHTLLSKKIWSWLVCAISLLGVLVAGRHVWLQQYSMGQILINGFAEQSQQLSFVGYLHQAMDSSLCAQVQWAIFGVSLASWTLMLFIAFVFIGVWQWLRK